MLTAEQYKFFEEQRQGLEARIQALQAEIAATQRDIEAKRIAAAGAQEREDFFARPELGVGPANQVEYAKQQRQQQRVLGASLLQKITELQAGIETKRAEIRRCQERLRAFQVGGIKGELRAYERAHEG